MQGRQIYLITRIFVYRRLFFRTQNCTFGLLGRTGFIQVYATSGRIFKEILRSLDLGLTWGTVLGFYCSNIEQADMSWALIFIPSTSTSERKLSSALRYMDFYAAIKECTNLQILKNVLIPVSYVRRKLSSKFCAGIVKQSMGARKLEPRLSYQPQDT